MKKIMIITAVVATLSFVGCKESLTPDDAVVEKPSGSPGEGDSSQNLRQGKVLDKHLRIYSQEAIYDVFPEKSEIYDDKTLGRTRVASDTADNVDGLDKAEIDEDPSTAGKYIIPKMNQITAAKLYSGGAEALQFLYYDVPQTGAFTMRARVVMTAKAGDATDKGFFFGAMTAGYDRAEDVNHGKNVTWVTDADHPEDGSIVEFAGGGPGGTGIRGAGILYRTNDTADTDAYPAQGPAIRSYFTRDGESWSTGLTNSAAGQKRELWYNHRPRGGWKHERIVEVVRYATPRTGTYSGTSNTVKIAYALRVYDSKSGELIDNKEAWIPANRDGQSADVQLASPYIQVGTPEAQPVYLGLAIMGCNLEFSEFTVWDAAFSTITARTPEEMQAGLEKRNNERAPVFSTPPTSPAYVGVDRITNINVFYPEVDNSNATNSLTQRLSQLGLPSTGATNIITLGTSRLELIKEPDGLVLKPVFTPTYADNHNFTWEVVRCIPPSGKEYLQETIEAACTLHYTGIEGDEEKGYPSARLSLSHVTNNMDDQYCYLVMATSKDPGLADYSVEIWVRGAVQN
ncbi:MAG: hypothetical protein LBE74_03110 [Treponema sp.]|jgi:hypothetical protein|nr:hypothetical protein [Treponema sp.]